MLVVLGAEERFKNLGLHVFGDARPGVADADGDASAAGQGAGGDGDRAAATQRVAGVGQQDDQHLLHLIGVAGDLRQGRVGRDAQLDLRQLVLVHHQRAGAFDGRVQLGHGVLRRSLPGEGQEAFHELAATLAFAFDDGLIILDAIELFGRKIELAQFLHRQPGVGEHAEQRVIHLVRDRGRELAERDHLLALDHPLVRFFELGGLVVHALLEAAPPLLQLRVGQAQLFGHPVERSGQQAQLIAGLDVDAVAEVAAADAQRSVDQLTHRAMHEQEDEAAAREAHDERGDDGETQHLRPLFGQLRVDGVERQMGIDHAQDLSIGGVSVARGAAAIRSVLDGLNDRESPPAVRFQVHARPVFAIQTR